jgi:hypothetical protein
VLSQSFMSGAASFFSAASAKGDYYKSEAWWKQLTASAAVPRGVADLERSLDPNQRIAWDIASNIKSQIPYFSASLPPARDLWGRPLSGESGYGPWYDALSPFKSREAKAEPIDQELERLQKWVPTPSRSFTVAGGKVDLNKYPAAYSRYVELAGNGWAPEGQKGLMSTLNEIVTGKHDLSEMYQGLTDGPDGSKAALIDKYVELYKRGAQHQLLQEFPEIAAEVEASRERKIEALTPAQ